MLSFHCIAKLAVCCHHAEKIGKFDKSELKAEESDAQFVEKCIQMHMKTLKLVERTNSIYKIFNLGQFLFAIGFIVVTSFQIQSSVDKILLAFLLTLLLQLFMFCYLAECISVMVRDLKLEKIQKS
jgi:7tm Odorant receptor